jgi:ketosteroid isomerase-like protein
MIVRSLTLAVLMIGLAAPAIAQDSKGLAAPPRPDAEALKAWQSNSAFCDAYNKKDAAALAAMYADDASHVGAFGVVRGRQKIEKEYADWFKAGWTNCNSKVDTVYTQGPVAWAYGEWSATGPGPNGMHEFGGTWSSVAAHVGDGWQTMVDTWNIKTDEKTMAVVMPPATATGSTTPPPTTPTKK